jgi:hypothetical protein
VLVRQARAASGASAGPPGATPGANGQGQGQHRRRQAGQGSPGAQGGQPQSQ